MERTEQILIELRDIRGRVDRIRDKLKELKRIYDQLPTPMSRKQSVEDVQKFFDKLQEDSLPKVMKIIDNLDRESDEWVKKLKNI